MEADDTADPEAEYLGVRVAVLLAFVVAALSVVTGIANIGTESVVGPFASFVPTIVRRTAGFTGALTGFLMLTSAFGLRRRYRLGWTSTVALLPVTAAQGLLQLSPVSVPLVVLSVVALPTVAVNRSRFDRPFEPTPVQLAAVAALVGANAYGTVGAYALRDQFVGVDSLTDAFYFTIVTGSTVGYGDVAPVGEIARLFALSALLVNVSAFAVALGVLLTPAIEARFARALGRMTEIDLDLLDDHVLVLGYGDLTEAVLDELAGVELLVVTPDQSLSDRLRDHDVNVVVGDPSDETTLRRAGLGRARAVIVGTEDDAADALSILTTRQLDPDVRIVAGATHRENVRKLERAGADQVISPATIGGRLLVRSALGDADEEGAVADLADELMGDG